VSFSILDTRVADPGVPPITVRDMKHARSVLLPEVRRVAKELGVKLFPADLELFGVQDDELKRTAAGELSRGWYENHPCYWVFYHVTITSDGMIRPCGNRLMHRDYGNLRTHTAREILSGKSIIQFLGQMRERPAQIEACRGCEMKLQVNRSIHEAIAQLGGI
jgi:radical SAM protein with 4Fe4S-binding SPASM domain